jgi:hypothetical protein
MDERELNEANGLFYAQKGPFFQPTVPIEEIFNEKLQTFLQN